MNKIGKIKEIYRYPVKSFQGEKLSSSKVETYGLRGDRSHAFINHERADKHLSAKKIPYLLGYSAQFIEDVCHHDLPNVQVKSPQGKFFGWDDELLQHMRERFKLDLSMKTYPMNHNGPTAVDDANLLLTTDASLSALERINGEYTDVRRFRPNLVVHLDEQKPFEEINWLGRSIQVGDVEAQVYEQCQRCLMIGVDPENTSIDMSILRNVAQHLDANFGVYARVIKTGTVSASDQVYID